VTEAISKWGGQAGLHGCKAIREFFSEDHHQFWALIRKYGSKSGQPWLPQPTLFRRLWWC